MSRRWRWSARKLGGWSEPGRRPGLPWPGGRLRLAHIRWSYIRGLYHRPAATLHLSAGLGTTFVPFRFAARPEVTELVLQPE